jgi:hypothetical protein
MFIDDDDIFSGMMISGYWLSHTFAQASSKED